MRAVISGIGVVSPFGIGRERFWSCARAGCSAARRIPEFEAADLTCQVAAPLPELNTPQPTRQRNKLPKQAQPVPPMFTPESIADMVVWAAEQEKPPRELLVGRPAVQAVWGQKLIPGLLDWYLGRNGWEAQMIDQPNEQHGRDILFETLAGDPGAHGPYRERERGPDWQMRLRTHSRAVLAGSALLAIGSLLCLRRT